MLLSKIKLNPDNPRIIKDDKYKKLVQSIKEFPDMLEKRPLVVDENMKILGGNMRLRACMELRMKDVPVIVAKGWTDEQKREFIIKDNLPYGEWDWDILANQWDKQELDDWGMDLPTGLGENEVEEDEVPEVPEKAESKLGEVYQLGRHRLMCGDSTKIEDVEKLMDGNKADMVFTDPPYGMDLDTDYSGMKGWHNVKGKKYDLVIGDDKPFDIRWFDWIDCKEQFWWGADYYVETLPNFGKDGSWMIWDKRVDESKDKMFGSGFEMLWSKQKHQRRLIRQMWAGFMGDAEASKRVHPTQKPSKLAIKVISEYGNNGDIVLDLFGGSGSTLIACEQTDRTCYMMEIAPCYCDVILERWENFTGNKTKLLN